MTVCSIIIKRLLLTTLFFALLISYPYDSNAQINAPSASAARLIVMADMGNEPDEEQQMIHMLICSNEFDIDGLIAVSGKFLRPPKKPLQPELFHKLIKGYSRVYPNLKLHAKGWHTPEYLHSIVASGQNFYGIADVKPGNSSPGSQLIVMALDKPDPRPIWVVGNAGTNTLAQALVDYRATHTQQQLRSAIAKLRVFENGAQDNSGAWICSKFPLIHWIRSNYQTYAYGGPGGDGERSLGPNYWHPYDYSPEGQHAWLKEHVQTDHGALGDLYPDRRFYKGAELAFMEGGGTVPFLGLVNKGLFDIDHPSWGGWSGRFSAKKVPDFFSRHADILVDERKVAPFYTYREVSDVWIDPQDNITYTGDDVPVWRWRSAMYADFINRMDWCVKPYKEANHHPVAAIENDRSDAIIPIRVMPGEIITFDASASTDPDGHQLNFSWWIYEEAGTYPGRISVRSANRPKAYFTVPAGAGGKQIHLILEVSDRDKGTSLPLVDYRRVVIDIADLEPRSDANNLNDGGRPKY